MSMLALGIAVFVFVNVVDRLRLINWKTTKPATMVLYLSMAALALWVVYDGFTGEVEAHQWFTLIVALLWLHLTRSQWRSGVPEHVKSAPAPLGEPELPSRQ